MFSLTHDPLGSIWLSALVAAIPIVLFFKNEYILLSLWKMRDQKLDEVARLLSNITDYKHIRFSDKSQDDICLGIQEFCQIFNCEKNELCFYEDDRNVIIYLQLQGVKVKEVEPRKTTKKTVSRVK